MKLLFIILLFIGSIDATKKKYQKATRTGNPLEAIEYYRQIIREAPKSAYADSSLFRIGMFYYLIGDYEQVINTLEVIFYKVDESSLYRKACYWLKFSYQNMEDSTKALEFSKLIESFEEPEKSKQEIPIKSEEIKTQRKSVLYIVQLGAYRDKEWADLFMMRLKQHEIEYYNIGSGEYIKICSGKFSTKEEAEIHLQELRDNGFDGFVVEIKP